MRRDGEALQRFERATELPLLVLALAMVPLLVLPLLVGLPAGVEAAFEAADWLVWAVFAVDYLVRLALAPDRRRFLRREWPDLVIVVIPFLRPLRLARSARALRVLRLVRVAAVLSEVGQEGRRLLVRHHLHHALLAIGVVVAASAVIGFAVEDQAGGTIDSFGDALWWAVATVTTVGYGDTYPVTPAGRGIGAFLMVTGITLFGVLTANLAAFLVERDEPADQPRREADEVLRRMAALEAKLDRLIDASAAARRVEPEVGLEPTA